MGERDVAAFETVWDWISPHSLRNERTFMFISSPSIVALSHWLYWYHPASCRSQTCFIKPVFQKQQSPLSAALPWVHLLLHCFSSLHPKVLIFHIKKKKSLLLFNEENQLNERKPTCTGRTKTFQFCQLNKVTNQKFLYACNTHVLCYSSHLAND